MKGVFSFQLPPGKYEIRAYSEGPEASVASDDRSKEVQFGDISFTVDDESVDLGVIELKRNSESSNSE